MRRVITTLAFIVIAVSLIGCERYALDRQMEELCKKDGGVKVYETVTLPPAEYEKLFKYVITAKSQEDYYGPEYRYVQVDKSVVGNEADPAKGKGWLVRSRSAIFHRSDGRLLAESVEYLRAGGDLFTFGFQPSANYCPQPRVGLANFVFIKGER